MSEENKQGSDNAVAGDKSGSPIGNTGSNPNSFGGGEQPAEQKPNTNDENNNTSGNVPEEQYKSLEKKLGEQGSELGTLREKNQEFEQFFEEISPLMEKLENDKELISLIVNGKINSQLAKDVLGGKVSKSEAETVSEAHKEVKKDMGKKEYENSSPEEIENKILEKINSVIDQKIGETTNTFNKAMTDNEKLREYEKRTEKFVNDTSDISDYSERIAELVKEYPDISNIEVLYKMAKFDRFQKEEKEKNDNADTEEAKRMAMNAGGGGSHSNAKVNSPDVLNSLIGGTSDPNSF